MGEIIKGRVHLIFPLPPEKNTPKHKLNECPTCFNLDSTKDKNDSIKILQLQSNCLNAEIKITF